MKELKREEEPHGDTDFPNGPSGPNYPNVPGVPFRRSIETGNSFSFQNKLRQIVYQGNLCCRPRCEISVEGLQ